MIRKSIIIAVFCLILISQLSYVFAEDSRTTTIILLRHAEKILDGSKDPPLTDQGKLRAIELAYILAHLPIDAIYSTPFKRTRQTVKPIADEKNKKVLTYHTGNEKKFLGMVLHNNCGGIVLVAGHSNTVPQLVNHLMGNSNLPSLKDEIYDNIFIVSVNSLGKGKLIRLRFGKHTPEILK